MIARCEAFVTHNERRLRWIIAGIGLFANGTLLLRSYRPAPRTPIGDENYYLAIAHRIAQGELPLHHEFWPPLYGELVGLISSLSQHPLIVLQVIQILGWLAAGWFIPRIARHLGFSQLQGLIAFTLYFSSTELMAFSHFVWPETLHIFLVLGALDGLSGKAITRELLGAALLAACVLTKSLLLPLLPLILVWAIWRRRQDRLKSAIRMIGVMAAVLLIAWMLLGARAPSMFGQSAVFNLWVGSRETWLHDHRDDVAKRAFDQYMQFGDTPHQREAALRAECSRSLTAGSIVRGIPRHLARLLDRHSFLTTQLPGGDRASYAGDPSWLTRALAVYSRIDQFLVVTLAMIGVWAGWRTPGARPLIVLIAAIVAIYVLVHVKSRYLIQLLPLLCIQAAAPFDSHWVRRLGNAPRAAVILLPATMLIAWSLFYFLV